MPSAIAHAAPALVLYPLFEARAAFRFGIPYEHVLGHRGLSHSIPFAAVFAALLSLAVCWRPRPGVSHLAVWTNLFLATASHGLLDTLTNGGLGVALLSPFDTTRYFAPFRPIEVSPLGLQRFLSPQGVRIVLNELLSVWAPCALLALLCKAGARSSPAPR